MLAAARACPRLLRPTTTTIASPLRPTNFSLVVPKRRAMASAAAATDAPKYLLLNYSYVPDILEKRGPYREAHLAGAQKKLEAGKLICAGAVGAPPKGATFFFKGASREEVEQFVKDDAYVQNGLVTAWSIDPYTVVVGDP